MSDDYVHVIPEEPGIVPDEEKRRNAVSYFWSIAPHADEVTTSVSDGLKFIDCGGNFGEISCPSCGAGIEIDLWRDWMNADCGDQGFTLSQHEMPCCGARHTLHDLRYEWPQGFARCEVQATTPNVGKLSDEQRAQFEAILGCPVRVIYEHM